VAGVIIKAMTDLKQWIFKPEPDTTKKKLTEDLAAFQVKYDQLQNKTEQNGTSQLQIHRHCS